MEVPAHSRGRSPSRPRRTAARPPASAARRARPVPAAARRSTGTPLDSSSLQWMGTVLTQTIESRSIWVIFTPRVHTQKFCVVLPANAWQHGLSSTDLHTTRIYIPQIQMLFFFVLLAALLFCPYMVTSELTNRCSPSRRTTRLCATVRSVETHQTPWHGPAQITSWHATTINVWTECSMNGVITRVRDFQINSVEDECTQRWKCES